MFRAVLTVIAVLLLAYWCSRLLAKQWVKTTGLRHLKIIEQVPVGQNQKILLLNIGESNYLIGVSQAGIQLLTEVEGDFNTEESPLAQNLPGVSPFGEVLDQLLKKPLKKKGGDK